MTARVCLPVSDWPLTDVEAWNAAHRRGGLLDDNGLAANWAPATSLRIAEGYGRFLSFLIETRDYDPSETPAMRITRSRVESYVAHLRERNHSTTVAARALQLTEAMRIMAPGEDWGWLRRIRSRLQRMSKPARDDRARLLPAATVFELHRDLVRCAEEGEGLSDLTRALMFRDGAVLAVFSVSGIRRKNMASIAIGSSLQRRGAEWWLGFRADEMKNNRPYEAPLPGLTGLLDRYIEHYRPILVARSTPPVAGNALWVSASGKRASPYQIWRLVSCRTKRALGRALCPLLLRKLPPTELAIKDPEHVAVAQPILGHANYRMTERVYNLGRAIDAARRHHDVLRAIRATGSAARQPGRRAGRTEPSTKLKGRPRHGTPNAFKKG
jgi:site-specific recombinase XerD